MERKRIYLSSPTMHGEEQAFVQSAFDTNWVAPLGPNVDAFEKEMADYIGGGYAAALSAGTAAIHLAVILAGVKEGDVVFAQSLTFAASVNPACYEKAKPVFIDSEPDTWNMDPVALEKAFENIRIRQLSSLCICTEHLPKSTASATSAKSIRFR